MNKNLNSQFFIVNLKLINLDEEKGINLKFLSRNKIYSIFKDNENNELFKFVFTFILKPINPN